MVVNKQSAPFHADCKPFLDLFAGTLDIRQTGISLQGF